MSTMGKVVVSDPGPEPTLLEMPINWIVPLRVARSIREMTQLELALRIGLSASTISMIERGLRPPTHLEREQISKELRFEQTRIAWKGLRNGQ